MPYWRQYRDLFITRDLSQMATEIRNLIGNAVPMNFSWEDLMKFVPDIAVVSNLIVLLNKRLRLWKS
jgi:hypothetical protein